MQRSGRAAESKPHLARLVLGACLLVAGRTALLHICPAQLILEGVPVNGRASYFRNSHAAKWGGEGVGRFLYLVLERHTHLLLQALLRRVRYQ